MKSPPTITQCGVRCNVGTPAPPNAKWVLWFWDYIIYHRTKKAAKRSLGRLSYYEAEDAEILPVNRKPKNVRMSRLAEDIPFLSSERE